MWRRYFSSGLKLKYHIFFPHGNVTDFHSWGVTIYLLTLTNQPLHLITQLTDFRGRSLSRVLVFFAITLWAIFITVSNLYHVQVELELMLIPNSKLGGLSTALKVAREVRTGLSFYLHTSKISGFSGGKPNCFLNSGSQRS